MVRRGNELEALEKQFVCVRLIKMDGLDLRLFQFDYDQTWCAIFLNADGTIYGRYGTRRGGREESATHISIPSFKKAIERALRLHVGYPGNKNQFAAKRGPEPDYPTANRIPNLEIHHCIHCHQVREGLLRIKWQEKRLTPRDIWPYPLPENIGLKMEVDDGLRVEKVTPQSPAAESGLKPGDELLTLNGQPLTSQADIQWVLHQAPVEATLPVTFRRHDKEMQTTLVLKGVWKEAEWSWRASSEGLRRGLYTEPLSEAEKNKRDLPADALGLIVKHMDRQRSASLIDGGLRQGDVIVAVDGKNQPMTESQLITYLRLTHPAKDKFKLTILRAGRRENLELPMW